MAEDTKQENKIPSITITLTVTPGRLTQIQASQPLEPYYAIGLFTELADAHRGMLNNAREQMQNEMLAKQEAERKNKIFEVDSTPKTQVGQEMPTSEPAATSPESQSDNHPG